MRILDKIIEARVTLSAIADLIADGESFDEIVAGLKTDAETIDELFWSQAIDITRGTLISTMSTAGYPHIEWDQLPLVEFWMEEKKPDIYGMIHFSKRAPKKRDYILEAFVVGAFENGRCLVTVVIYDGTGRWNFNIFGIDLEGELMCDIDLKTKSLAGLPGTIKDMVTSSFGQLAKDGDSITWSFLTRGTMPRNW